MTHNRWDNLPDEPLEWAPNVVPLTTTADADDAFEAQVTHHRAVTKETARLRVQREARRVLDTEEADAAGIPPFDAGYLHELLARPADPPHRVDQLIPSDAGTLLVAQRKTGKTTFELNLAKSLITGEPFLDKFDVRPINGIVALLNYEVSAAMIGRWADDVGLPDDRIYFVNLRGRRNPLKHPQDRERLAGQLRDRGVESLIVDPFGRAFTGASQNDPGDVGSWLSDLDLFARAEVGATDLVLTAHAGWNGERTRGSTALEDWADSIITLTRGRDDDDQPADDAPRFMRAIGRDVELPEDQLRFDPHTRRLTLTGFGSRRKVKSDGKLHVLLPHALKVVQASPGIGVGEVVLAVRRQPDAPLGWQDREMSKVLQHALDEGLLRSEGGTPGVKRRHYPPTVVSPQNGHPVQPVQPSPMDALDVPPLTPSTPSIDGRGGGRGPNTTHPPTPSGRGHCEDAGCTNPAAHIVDLHDGPPMALCATCTYDVTAAGATVVRNLQGDQL